MNADVKTALLLAAGRGKRLRPHTDHTPKPLLMWKGQPTLAHIINGLERAGVKQVVLVTHHLEEQIQAFANGFATSVALHCAHQENLNGTTDAILDGIHAKPDWFESPFLITACDYLTPPEFYPQFLQFHQSHSAPVSVSLKQSGDDGLAARSSVRYTGDFEILEVVEKPEPGMAPSPYAANLIYVVPETIKPLLSTCPVSPRGEREMQYAVNQLLDRHTGRGIVQDTPLEWSPDMPDES